MNAKKAGGGEVASREHILEKALLVEGVGKEERELWVHVFLGMYLLGEKLFTVWLECAVRAFRLDNQACISPSSKQRGQ